MENKELFIKFVEYLKKNAKERTYEWDKSRTKYIKDTIQSKKLILSELSYFDFQDPLNTLDKDYYTESYNPKLLFNELIELTDFINDESLNRIVEKIEMKERIKKLLDFYLNFVIEKNFDYLSMKIYFIYFF